MKTLKEALFSKRNLSEIGSVMDISNGIEKTLEIVLNYVTTIAGEFDYRYYFEVGHRGLFVNIILPLGSLDIPQNPNEKIDIDTDDVKIGFLDHQFRGVVPFFDGNEYTFTQGLGTFSLKDIEKHKKEINKCIRHF